MSALPMIAELSNKGIRVGIDGDELTLRAPKGVLTPALVEKYRAQKSNLLRSLAEVREQAGDDWQEIAGDPDKLKAFTELVMINDMRQRGIVPDHYTAMTKCSGCGTVPIFEGVPERVSGCPWCFNRLKGLPMPSPGADDER